MAAKLPAIRRGEVPSIETWAFAEPVERTLASALVVQGLKSAIESSPSVKRGSTLKIAPGLLWGWTRTDAGVAQCFFATDPPNRLCQLRSPKG